ncbi:WXG100-like domain-containing protein [Flindersiella endophytica]
MAAPSLTIPGQLADLLNMLGYTWPKSKEGSMFELGQEWMDFGGKLKQIHGETVPHAETVTAENVGHDIEAFKKKWIEPDAGAKVVEDGGTGSMVVGGGLFVAAGLVLALKIATIVQLTILAIQIATAIASAVPTFGASLAWIPIAKTICSKALDLAIDQVINALLG